ncbi:Rho-GTPase-activating protein [Rhizoctonia solani]|uniref:Rho-GTPase-activating protein n=1 Tax=Rhizoctonia solani TaxID=456999 RepID=A0A8H8NRJ2_9AGAM|nr:Rho-GTPase-activating protein [Rhizoctonia solani]QRW17295.1 Rho-GTPase-activating protein [Rhizoctonia solani]
MPEGQPQYPPRTMSLPKGTPPGSPGPGRSPSPTDWGDDIPVVSIAPGSLGDDLVPTGFDEAVLRSLCELDCGVPLLLDRIKQSMVSCREASIFFRKRAALEDEFGRGLFKLARTTTEVYAMNDGKAGSFVSAWASTMKIHEIMGESRVRFAQRLAEMSDELASLAKEVERNRKNAKDLGARYERALQDAETAMEKAKARVSAVTEELERVLVAKEGETMRDAGLRGADGRVIGTGGAGKGALGKAVAKGGALLKGKPASLQKQEEDIRARLSMASDGYRQSMLETQKIRQEYFNFQLPRILRSLKECADEIDLGTQYHLSRYAFLLESPGIKLTIESIDNRTDFKLYMQNYAVAHGAPKGPRREGPAEDGFLPPLPTLDTVQSHLSTSSSVHPSSSVSTSTSSAPSGTPTYPHAQAYGPTQAFPPLQPQPPPAHTPSFGIPLAHLVVRDGTECPKVLTKCAETIERHGLDSVGIYRLSGTTSRVRELRAVLDKDLETVDLDSNEWSGDINNITSVLKMWFRELPEPLMTWELYSSFVEAAQIEGERLRSIRLHEHVNALPDANYSTLKYLMGHLYRISEREHVNQMSRSNLAIVFGPTLLGARREDGELGASVQDTSWQCKAIETILDKYVDIFVDQQRRLLKGWITTTAQRTMALPTRRSGEQRGDEEGYWDAIGDEDEGPHLFWVPAHLHPEIAPSEFRAFLKEHARAASDEGSGSNEGSSQEASSEESAEDKPLPFPGPARALSTGVTRKKSMLSRQYRGTRRRRRAPAGQTQSHQHIRRSPAHDQRPPEDRRARAGCRSRQAARCPPPQSLAQCRPLVPRQGRRVAGQYRRGRLAHYRPPAGPDPASCGPHQDPQAESARRWGRTPLCIHPSRPSQQPVGLCQRYVPSTRRPPLRVRPHHRVRAPCPPAAPALAPDDDWHSDRPMSYTDESTIFDAYADRRDSMTSLTSDEAHNQISALPLDLALGIPAPAVTPTTSQPMLDRAQEEPASQLDSEPLESGHAHEHERELEAAPEPELHHPAPQRHLVAIEQPVPERTPSPGRSHSASASPASSDLHLPQSQPQSQSQPAPAPPRKEKKGGLFGMGKKSKKDKDSEKETGFFGSLFGGSKSKKADDSNHGFSGGQAAAAALLGASKSKSPAPPNQQQPNQPVIQPSANGTYARYPIHVERAVYRLSHIKLANPRRPLYEQVLISNLMFWYLGVINKQQQEEKERAAEREREERERKDKDRDREKDGKDGKAGAKGKAANAGARKAEMPVRGPQYEMQNRQMTEEYTQQQQQQQRPASAPPTDRQYHLPARQQQQQQPQQQRVHSSGDAEFGYSPKSNGGPQGLPPGAMAPQVPHSPTSPTSSQTNLMNNTYTGGGGPYPPMNRPKSAGKGSTGSLGSRNRREASEDDTPLSQLGGSLGRRGR